MASGNSRLGHTHAEEETRHLLPPDKHLINGVTGTDRPAGMLSYRADLVRMCQWMGGDMDGASLGAFGDSETLR